MPLSLPEQFSDINALIAAADTVELRRAALDRIAALIRDARFTLSEVASGLGVSLDGPQGTRLSIGNALRKRFPPMKEMIEGAPFLLFDEVFVPSDLYDVPLESPRTFSRTAFALEVVRSLSVDFSQCSFQSGIVRSSEAKRGASYRVLAVPPSIDKVVLVCDEEGNPTFVVKRENPPESYRAMKRSKLKSLTMTGEAAELIWTGDENEWKHRLAQMLIASPSDASVSSTLPANPFPAPESRVIEMDKDYFCNSEIVRRDLEAYAAQLGAGKTPVDLSTRNMASVTCFSGEKCRGEKYLLRAAVALGIAEIQTEVESTAEVLARLKGIAGIKVYPPMDKTYFILQNVQHDLAAFAAAIGHGMTVAGLSTRNLESISRVVCANEEPCLPMTYLLKAGVALGIAKNMTKGQPKGAPALRALKRLIGIEIVEYPPMNAAYFIQENIRKDLLAYAAKLGSGKTIDDLSTENMPGLDAICSNGEPCNGKTYINRAGKGLGMARNTREAHSKAANILFLLKHRSGLLKRTALLA